VKPTADRGRAEGWMCLASDPPARPELSRGTCEVWDGDRWTLQSCVTVLTAACAFAGMLDVQIFCTEESKRAQNKLNATLKRAVNILHVISPEKLEEGDQQLSSAFMSLANELSDYKSKKLEQKPENNNGSGEGKGAAGSDRAGAGAGAGGEEGGIAKSPHAKLLQDAMLVPDANTGGATSAGAATVATPSAFTFNNNSN